MNKMLLGLVLLSSPTFAQVSVYSCDAYNDPTQAEILNSGGQFYQGCIDLSDPGNYTLQQNFAQEIKATNSIHITDVFHAGPYTGTANTHMLLGTSSPFDVAVMNGVMLDNLQRYDKLELGVMLPEPYRTKLENFILKQENPSLTIPSGNMLNPFLEWELDVEAEFTRVGFGTVQKVEAFFTIDQKRNYSTLLWDDIPSDYHMRVRFAPPENGAWTAKIKIKVNEVLVSESISFPLFVVESGKHGYISVHPNGKNLQLDGEVIFPVGQNFPAPEMLECLSDSCTGLNTPWPYSQDNGVTEFRNSVLGWQKYIDSIDHFGQIGGRFTRIFMAPHAGLVEWEEKGNYYRRMHQAYEIDSVIKVHEKNGMFVMFDLLLHNYFMTWGDYNSWEWDWDRHLYCNDKDANGNYIPCGIGPDMVQHGERYYPNANIHGWELNFPVHPYNDNPGNYLDPNQNPKMPHDMFLLESDIQYHEQRIRYYISRYGYSTSIYMWEQMDEIFHMDEDAFDSAITGHSDVYRNPSNQFYTQSHNAVNNYVRRMNKFIRENMEHKHQLLALNCFEMKLDNQPNYSHDLSILDPYGDCFSRSFYPILPDDMIRGGIGNHDDPDYNLNVDSEETSMINRKVAAFTTLYNQTYGHSLPMLFGESGPDGNYYTDRDCNLGHDEFIDNMRFGFIGAAGFNKWHFYQGNKFGVYENIISADQFMNDQDVKNVIGSSVYYQGRQFEEITTGSLQNGEGDALEMQYYITQDKSTAAGYVYNRTINYKTAGGGNCYTPGYDNKSNFNDMHAFDWEDDGPFKKLKMVDMPNFTDYLVDFYSYPDGNHLSDYVVSTGTNGKFIVEFPLLNHDLPIVWFVIHQLGNKKCIEFNVQDTNTIVSTVAPLIYPNPTTTFLYVPKSIENVVIQNGLGQHQEIKIIKEERDYLVIDIKDFSSGVYFLISSTLESPLKFIKL